MLNKFNLLAAIVFASFHMLFAQSKDALCPELYPYPANLFSYDMNHLPKVQVNVRNNGKLKGYILLTTHRSSENPYFSSVQLIDLENPTLPVWFGCVKETSQFFITDSKLLPNGNLSFFLKSDTLQFPLPEVLGEGAKGIVEGYFELDNTLKPIEFMTMAGINHHDYKKFPNGDRLVLVGDGKELNLSKYKFKGQQLSKKVYVGCEAIVIIDKNNQEVFRWNPLDHLDFSELDIDRYADLVDHNPEFTYIQFARTNSINIDPIDGNILASFRRADMCVKIDRNTGKILWRLGGIKSDFTLNDTAKFYLQHDIKRIVDGPYKGMYSIFNNGNSQNPVCEGLIYRLDEIKKTAKLEKRITANNALRSYGQGNFDIYSDSTALLNYGNVNPVQQTRTTVINLFNKDTVIADITLPKDLIVYRATWLKNFSLTQPSASLLEKNNELVATAEKSDISVYWSQHDSTYNTLEGQRSVVFYKKTFGIGYLVSKPAIDVTVKKILFPAKDLKRTDAMSITSKEKCLFSLNLNGMSYDFRKQHIDLQKMFMILNP